MNSRFPNRNTVGQEEWDDIVKVLKIFKNKQINKQQQQQKKLAVKNPIPEKLSFMNKRKRNKVFPR